jgi:hypothetical protein
VGAQALILALIAVAHAAPCDDPALLVHQAKSEVTAAEFASVEATIAKVEAAFACGSVANQAVLGELWLIEGAWLFYQEGADAAAPSFRAAARAEPGLWIDDLGDQVKAAYDEAVAQASDEIVTVSGHEIDGWLVAVDGLTVTLPADIEAGLHLLQVGDGIDDMRYAAFGDLPAGDFTLKHALGPWQPPAPIPTPLPDPVPVPSPDPVVPDPEPVPQPKGEPKVVGLHLAAGFVALLGNDALGTKGEVLYEPATKLLIPIEAGLRLQLTPGFWMRGAASAAPVLNGQFLYTDEAKVLKGSFAGLGANGGLGGTAGPLDLGVLAGVSWPARLPFRGLLAINIANSGLRIEARGGVNVATGGRTEPAAGLAITFDPLR